MKEFAWGEVIQKFDFDMGGKMLEIIKFHPYLPGSKISSAEIRYHVQGLHESWATFDGAVIGWMVRQRLGMNHGALVAGICRMLEVK